MRYITPELVVLGPAATLVLGGVIGLGDNANPDFEYPDLGLALGLDD
jgi:hypothetical protein